MEHVTYSSRDFLEKYNILLEPAIRSNFSSALLYKFVLLCGCSLKWGVMQTLIVPCENLVILLAVKQ